MSVEPEIEFRPEVEFQQEEEIPADNCEVGLGGGVQDITADNSEVTESQDTSQEVTTSLSTLKPSRSHINTGES